MIPVQHTQLLQISTRKHSENAYIHCGGGGGVSREGAKLPVYTFDLIAYL